MDRHKIGGRLRSREDIEQGLKALLALDSRLVPVAEQAGPLPLRLLDPGLESLAVIVTGQMISRASADAINARMRTLFDPFSAETLRDADASLYRQAGQSLAKERTLRAIGQAIAAGDLKLSTLHDQPVEDALRALTSIKGIGPWTAEVYLLFCVGHADIFPAHDIALRVAVAEGLGLTAQPEIAVVKQLANSWAPWRGIAARLFWAYYAARRGRAALPA